MDNKQLAVLLAEAIVTVLNNVKREPTIEAIPYYDKELLPVVRAKRTNVTLRKYDAIYKLRAGESVFYNLPERSDDVESFRCCVMAAAKQARRHHKVAQYRSKVCLENGGRGVRVYRTV